MGSDVKITVALANAILQYLGTRPYAEVYQLIDEIRAQAAASQNQETRLGTETTS